MKVIKDLLKLVALGVFVLIVVGVAWMVMRPGTERLPASAEAGQHQQNKEGEEKSIFSVLSGVLAPLSGELPARRQSVAQREGRFEEGSRADGGGVAPQALPAPSPPDAGAAASAPAPGAPQAGAKKKTRNYKAFATGKRTKLSQRRHSIYGLPALGDRGAKVAIVEFSSYRCPSCFNHLNETMPELKRGYIDTGKIRYFLRPYPLWRPAKDAAVAAMCLEAQKKDSFWVANDFFFRKDFRFNRASYLNAAKALRLNSRRFESCLDSPKAVEAIEKGMKRSKSLVTGTPTFLVGKLKHDRVGGPGLLLSGRRSYSRFAEIIDSFLADDTL